MLGRPAGPIPAGGTPFGCQKKSRPLARDLHNRSAAPRCHSLGYYHNQLHYSARHPAPGGTAARRVLENMNRDVDTTSTMDLGPTRRHPLEAEAPSTDTSLAPRMRYRSRPVTVAVDPVSLVISECISITSAFQKHARSPHSSVSAILGGNPHPVQLGSPSAVSRGASKSYAGDPSGDGSQDIGLANRWGLRGKRGKSIQDNPLMAAFGTLRQELAAVRGILKALGTL